MSQQLLQSTATSYSCQLGHSSFSSQPALPWPLRKLFCHKIMLQQSRARRFSPVPDVTANTSGEITRFLSLSHPIGYSSISGDWSSTQPLAMSNGIPRQANLYLLRAEAATGCAPAVAIKPESSNKGFLWFCKHFSFGRVTRCSYTHVVSFATVS
jgi:hypothetical protein